MASFSMDVLYCFFLFLGASIYAGVHCRWILGNAAGGECASHAGQKGDAMVEIAWAFINRYSVIRQYPPESVDQELSQQLGKEKKDSPRSSGGRFDPNQKVQWLRNRLIRFMEHQIYPMEHKFYELAQSDMRWSFHPEEQRLKELAKKEGLWNLWIPVDSATRVKQIISARHSMNYWVLVYQTLSMDTFVRSWVDPSGPLRFLIVGAADTGNMEVLMRDGNAEQFRQWLAPLVEGTIRSGFAMTEPQVASSDATNIECSITRLSGH